jgi:Leucine-rich repeat (LRR) protein
MTKHLRIKKYCIITLCMMLFSLASFAQEYSDKTIGFDVARITASLKEHGVKDQDLKREIELMRETYIKQYVAIKKGEDEILQKEASARALKMNKITNNRLTSKTTNTLDVQDIPQTEKDALLALYNSTNGYYWAKKNGWDFSKPVTSWIAKAGTGWYGITIADGHIVQIDLPGNNLNGSIPVEIGQLTQLQYLYLSNNQLSGTIPPQIGQLTQLQLLDLGLNHIIGTLPAQIWQLTQLQYLYLNNNQLSGSIPPQVGQLTQLQYLNLYFNQLSGSIPSQIGQLTQLKSLNLAANKLSGSIPPQIGQLTQLQSLLNLSGNQFSGSLPAEIGQLTQLQNLILYVNQLSGTIPPQIGQLTQLQLLDLSSNQLSGTIPPQIGQLTLLQRLYIASNQLSGTIPPQIGQLSQLNSLSLTNNQLSGRIPPEIGQLAQLHSLSLELNQITGIPSEIKLLHQLQQFFISSNKISSIPAEIGQLTDLRFLYIRYNQLGGSLPVEMGQLTNLQLLHLNGNKLSGNLINLESFNDLEELYIGENNFRFIDFASQFSMLKNRSWLDFYYTYQSKTDTEKTIAGGIGGTITLSMYEDSRFTPVDTYQWYKNGQAIQGATTRQYTLSNLTSANAGDYYCVSTNPQITDLTLTRNTIHLNIITCTPIAGTINSPLDKFCNNTESAFSFATNGSNLTYDWSASTTGNVVVNSMKGDTSGIYKYTFITPGTYIIKAEVTEITGCKTTFTKSITVDACDFESTCVNKPVNMSFETTAANLNYSWYTLKQGSDIHLSPIINTTGLYTFIPTTAGTYTIYRNAYKNKECQFEFNKTIVVKSCEPFVSCTKSNRNTANIKSIFTTLVNKLISLPAATITNGYTCDELTALAFYVKDKNPAIYNFTHDTQQGFIAFSFTDHAEYDVKIATNGNVAAAFNLDNYDSDTIETELRTGLNDPFKSFVNHVDFCSALYCVSHIAFVVDESGSISTEEAGKIKKQLKKYVQQQADDNDKLQSNVYVSLIGMSDNDKNNRIDHVQQIRVTNDPEILKKFNTWIDNYGTVNGKRRVTASSDYWKSGLDVALKSAMKPSVVIMITDGCETTDVNLLRDQTMSQFNNSKSTLNTSLDKPHLYVLGIENGFYVDGGINGIALSNNEDPNYTQTASSASIESRVVPNLRTSLKYLLDYPLTEFPQADIENFRDFDYYGSETFNFLGTEAFLSDNLKITGFSCGKPTDKNYCSDCLSFQPFPGKEYMLSAWVKEELSIQVKTYENAAINIIFYNDVDASELHQISKQKLTASGDIIDGWQRITSKFLIPEFTKTISIELQNDSNGIPVYFDDIRIHPLDGSIKTFVYDPETFKLMSELDENNYSTFYEYDNEGGLVRVKKETSKGIKTIQETRSGNVINTTQN